MDYAQDHRPSGNLPYPNLVSAYTVWASKEYFMEPEKLSKLSKEQHAMWIKIKATANATTYPFPSSSTRPRLTPSELIGKTTRRKTAAPLENICKKLFEDFGSFSPVYVSYHGNVSHSYVFYRRNHGNIDFGLGRPNEDVFECAKFNILRYPLDNEKNSPNYTLAQPGNVSGLDQAMLNLANYPNLPHTVMSAPLLPRSGPVSAWDLNDVVGKEGRFAKPRAEQPALFTKILATPELCIRLVKCLGHRWTDMSNFSRTCQLAMFSLNEVATRVDLTTGNFLNLQFGNDEIEKQNKLEAAANVGKPPCAMPGSSEFIFLSPIRGPYHKDKDGEGKPNRNGYPAPPKGTYFRPKAERCVTDTLKLFRTVDARGSFIKVLHLHSVPNLNVEVLKLILPRLPHLETLGIHNCELLHFGKTVDVINAIIERNDMPGMSHVKSDFSPKYYDAPQRASEGRRGCYGVVPSDQGTIDTRRAVAAVLGEVVPLAFDNGLDWFTPGAGFRNFLDRLPFALGTTRWILEAYHNIRHYEIHYQFEARSFPGLRAAMERVLYRDLVISVHGRAMEEREVERMMTGSGGVFHLTECAFCHVRFPSYFFTTESMNRRPHQRQCCGCQLKMLLDNHVDNFFQEKMEVTRRLLDDPIIIDLDSFLRGVKIAADEDIANPEYQFWHMSKMNADAVHKANLLGKDGLVVGDRPGPEQPPELKEVYIWTERLFSAMRYARVRIDQARDDGSTSLLARLEKKMDALQAQYDAGLPSAAAARENRDALDRHERHAKQEKARLGRGQMVGVHGTTAAANWDTEIARYRQMVQVLSGAFRNQGPRPMYGNAATGFS
ncbi:hypothetical protein M426DRAFT_319592 [Hypoxylon sp. CI-4A]|nr:hypothetical protein M426DRAFT_319592 [Hypoxylon sp. CI-4A]